MSQSVPLQAIFIMWRRRSGLSATLIALALILCEGVAGLASDAASENTVVDSNILLAWKNNITDVSGLLSSWTYGPGNSSGACTSWFGVKCNAEGRIVKIDISFKESSDIQKLSGILPPSFGNLTSLQALVLDSNAFTGPLPKEWASLSQLKNLSLSFNSLTGDIPEEYGQLTSLERLWLVGCNLTGPIPKSFGNLSRLAGLQLGGNRLVGSIPEELCNCTNLIALDLSNNLISGALPALLPQKLCPRLEQLNIINNSIQGNLPQGFGRCTNLEYLDISHNQFSGGIPSDLGSLTKLLILAMNDNKLTGPVPPQLRFGYMHIVQLFNNRLTGTLPDSFCVRGRESQLHSFSAANNSLAGPIPLTLASCGSNLTQLDLSNNQFHGSIPYQLASTSLDSLSLQNNLLTGELDPRLSRFMNLTALDLSSNQLSGLLPPSLGQVGTLTTLRLGRNRFHGPLPESFGQLALLSELEVGSNSLSGRLPVSLTNLSLLTSLNLKQNHFTGPIPSSLLHLPAITSLDLSGNNLTGPVPDIPAASPLQSLNLSGNSLTGGLPSNLTRIPILSLLDVTANRLSGQIPNSWGPGLLLSFRGSLNNFSGTIPGSLGNLQNIADLELAHNQLVGNIPTNLSQQATLVTLRLEGNLLSGPIPPALSALPRLRSFNVSHNDLSGQVPDGTLSAFPLSSFDGNPQLCGGPLLHSCQSRGPRFHSGFIVASFLGPLLALLLLALLLLSLWMRCHGSKQPWYDVWCLFRGVPPVPLLVHNPEQKVDVYRNLRVGLTFRDLYYATNGFCERSKIGNGSQGVVYRGILKGTGTVAIKRLKMEGAKSKERFLSEIVALSEVHHSNLVELLGSLVSHDPEECILIYNFVPGGNVHNRIISPPHRHWCFNSRQQRCLNDWSFRHNILVGTARSLNYLHKYTPTRILHRDLKPENVLLTRNLEPVVTDFGLARLYSSDAAYETATVSGTVGYMAPEYAERKELSHKVDVYANGVFILQLVTGKSPNDVECNAAGGLPAWCFSQAVKKSLDPRLESVTKYYKQLVGTMIIARRCLTDDPANRPSMEIVSEMLETITLWSEGIYLDNERLQDDSFWKKGYSWCMEERKDVRRTSLKQADEACSWELKSKFGLVAASDFVYSSPLPGKK